MFELPDNMRVRKTPAYKVLLRRVHTVLFKPMPQAKVSLLYLITPNARDFAGRLEEVYRQLIEHHRLMLQPHNGLKNLPPVTAEEVTKVNDWIAAVHFLRMYGVLLLPVLYFVVIGSGAVIVKWMVHLLGPGV